MKIVLLFSLIISTASFACEFTLAPQMVILGTAQNLDGIESKNCTKEIETQLAHIIQELEGRISSLQLAEMLSQKGHKNVLIQPKMFQVHQLKTLIREQLNLPAGVHVRGTSAPDGKGFLAIAPGDKVEIDCSACLFSAQQPLLVKVKGFDGSNTTVMATADFRKMVRAFRVISSTPAFSQFTNKAELKEVYVESIPHTGLVTDLNSLKFYRTNKPIKAGELLKYSDLNAVNLVKAGLKTEVILESPLVRIKTEGVSRNNGTLGDFVEVFHMKKNRKYQGKVIDVNKVLVEL